MQALLKDDWAASLEKEGLPPVKSDAPFTLESLKKASSDEPPCPACGTAAPLVNGECSDCGLYLG